MKNITEDDDNDTDMITELNLVRDALENSQSQLADTDDKGMSETRYQNYAYVVENAPISVMITDAGGLITFVNPKFEEVTGYKLHEVVGKNPNILNSGETPEGAYNDLWKTIKAGNQWSGVFHNRRKDGALFWERAVITGIKNAQGEISHYIAIKEDITEVKEAHKKLEQERLRIIQHSKMAEIGLIAAGILHEVGNPLAAIRGLICDIKDSCALTGDGESSREMIAHQLDQVLSEVDRITCITMDISEFSYSNNAKADLLDINGLVDTTCRLIQYDKRWDRIELRVVLDPELPPVNAIKDYIIQVLINLFSNAVYAVEQVKGRKSEVQVSTFHDAENIYISIKDNGCGIKQENLPRIFDNFFTNKDQGKGTGIGLALCKSLIDSHQGTIEIQSKEGLETEVCISLPIHSDTEV
ncbi:MAG: PAS domain S-box protein [Proteobacteria bacterium]|nr:PAS domain S-box protein [Pseudomonadota bacterium]